MISIDTEENLQDETRQLIIEKFKKLGLLVDENELKSEKKVFKSKLKYIDISKIKLFSFNPDKLLNKVSPITNKFFTLHGCAFFVILFFISFIVLACDDVDVRREVTYIKHIKVYEIIILYVMTVLGMALHEFSHGMACKKFGGKVTKLGVMLFYFQPAAYCEVSSMYLFDKKYKKIVTLLAGVMSEWIVNSLIIIIYSILLLGIYNIHILLYYVLLNFSVSILNIIPFIKLDGYWMLSVIMGVYNLREKSFEYLTAIVFGKSKSVVKNKKHIKIIVYGLMSLLFITYLWISVIVGILNLIKPIINSHLYKLVILIIIMLICLHCISSIVNNIKKVKIKY